MSWKLAIRYEVLPEDRVRTRFANAARYGFEAVELPGRYLPDYREELLADLDELPLPISSVSLGYRGSLVSSDAGVRATCREDAKSLLTFCARIGAVGLVMPPVLHQDPCPRVGLDPDQALAIQDEWLLESLPELAKFAAEQGVYLMLEPVNSFETDYMTTLGHAARICDDVGHEGLGITIDFFHMQITELDTESAIRQAARWIRHVHVAENTRVEPGPGQLDFQPGFEALRAIGYDGYVVVECRSLSGPAERVLTKSSQFLRRLF